MRIGLDVSAALAGDSGIKFYVEEILAALSRVGTGREFVLYAAFWRGPERLQALRLPKAPNFRLAFKRVPQRLLLPAEEYLRLGVVERWLGSWGVSAFHGLGNLLPPLRRIPSVVTVHHVGGVLDTAGPWSRFYFKTLAERSVRRADAVIAVSEFSRREVVRAYGIPESRAFAVLEGGPDPAFSPPPPGGSTRARRVSGPYLLYVGGILERKNLAALVRAYEDLRRRRPAPLKLVLAGPKGRYYPVLAELVRTLGLERDVVFLDRLRREEIVGLYRNAAVFAYPSLLEGFGFPVLEAMACGAPVVASGSGAIPEVAGDAAVLVDAADPAALARALASVLDDPARASELRRRGFERVRAFSWDRAAEGTLAVYDRLLKDGKIGPASPA